VRTGTPQRGVLTALLLLLSTHAYGTSQKSVTRDFSGRSYERSSRSRIDIGSPRKTDFTDPGAVFSITLKSTEQPQ